MVTRENIEICMLVMAGTFSNTFHWKSFEGWLPSNDTVGDEFDQIPKEKFAHPDAAMYPLELSLPPDFTTLTSIENTPREVSVAPLMFCKFNPDIATISPDTRNVAGDGYRIVKHVS
jgi:hypothetical protein